MKFAVGAKGEIPYLPSGMSLIGKKKIVPHWIGYIGQSLFFVLLLE